MSRKSKRKQQKPQSNIGNWLKKVEVREDCPEGYMYFIDPKYMKWEPRRPSRYMGVITNIKE